MFISFSIGSVLVAVFFMGVIIPLLDTASDSFWTKVVDSKDDKKKDQK